MVLPPGLILFLGLLVGGFIVSMTGILRKKKLRQPKYQPIGSLAPSGHSAGQGQYVSPMSYQNPASSDYALPSQQKDVTYCVIDGRLVDQ